MFRHSTNTASFFSVLMAGAHFLALSGGGCCGAGQHQFGNRRTSEQHHGPVQHRQRSRCSVWQRHGQLQHEQDLRSLAIRATSYRQRSALLSNRFGDTWPAGPLRFLTTLRATTIPPVESMRCLITPRASTTPLAESRRSLTTPRAATTPPAEAERSLATPWATTTLPSESRRLIVTLQAAPTSLSGPLPMCLLGI